MQLQGERSHSSLPVTATAQLAACAAQSRQVEHGPYLGAVAVVVGVLHAEDRGRGLVVEGGDPGHALVSQVTDRDRTTQVWRDVNITLY